MKKIVTCEEMKKLDNATIHKIGVASEVLMERAALKVVEERLFHLKGVRAEFYMAGNK